MWAQIVLKSGAEVVAELEDVKTTRNTMSGELTEMTWTTPEGWRTKLHTIQLDQIAAIVVHEDKPKDRW